MTEVHWACVKHSETVQMAIKIHNKLWFTESFIFNRNQLILLKPSQPWNRNFGRMMIIVMIIITMVIMLMIFITVMWHHRHPRVVVTCVYRRADLTSMMMQCSDLSASAKTARSFAKKSTVNEVQRTKPTPTVTYAESRSARQWSADQSESLTELFTLPGMSLWHLHSTLLSCIH